MRLLILAAAAALAFAPATSFAAAGSSGTGHTAVGSATGGAGAGKSAQCRDAKGKFIKCPPPAAASAKPHCTKGKPCGNTCIKATDVCHKP